MPNVIKEKMEKSQVVHKLILDYDIDKFTDEQLADFREKKVIN